MVPLGDEAQVEAPFGLLDIVLVLTQDRSTVCAEHTIGSKISLVHLMVLQGVMGEVEARFSLFRGSVNLDAR